MLVTRRYEQRLRAESAEATRQRILDALHEHLRDSPEKPVSVNAIARAAGVSRSTIYVIFGSRSGLFVAMVEEIIVRGGWERVARSLADPDALEQLRGVLSAGAEMLVADRDPLRAIFSMAALDEEVGAAIGRLGGRRERGMQLLARRLHDAGLLRDDVSVDEATDLLFVLSSFDTFDLLYSGRGLSPKQVSERIVETAERSLLKVSAS